MGPMRSLVLYECLVPLRLPFSGLMIYYARRKSRGNGRNQFFSTLPFGIEMESKFVYELTQKWVAEDEFLDAGNCRSFFGLLDLCQFLRQRANFKRKHLVVGNGILEPHQPDLIPGTPVIGDETNQRIRAWPFPIHQHPLAKLIGDGVFVKNQAGKHTKLVSVLSIIPPAVFLATEPDNIDHCHLMLS